jgi:hypothetical protein
MIQRHNPNDSRTPPVFIQYMSERTAKREQWLAPYQKVELPEESKNVIHKNEANVKDSSTHLYTQNYTLLIPDA